MNKKVIAIQKKTNGLEKEPPKKYVSATQIATHFRHERASIYRAQIVPYFMVAHSPTIWIQKDLTPRAQKKNKRGAQMVPFILKGKQKAPNIWAQMVPYFM